MLVLDAAPAKPREGVSKVEPGGLLTSDPEGVALPAAAKKGSRSPVPASGAPPLLASGADGRVRGPVMKAATFAIGDV